MGICGGLWHRVEGVNCRILLGNFSATECEGDGRTGTFRLKDGENDWGTRRWFMNAKDAFRALDPDCEYCGVGDMGDIFIHIDAEDLS